LHAFQSQELGAPVKGKKGGGCRIHGWCFVRTTRKGGELRGWDQAIRLRRKRLLPDARPLMNSRGGASGNFLAVNQNSQVELVCQDLWVVARGIMPNVKWADLVPGNDPRVLSDQEIDSKQGAGKFGNRC